MAIEASSYTPPEILDDMDIDVIHKRMLAELPQNLDQTEGGFIWDMTRPSAMEHSFTMSALNAVVQMIFPEWAEGEILDLHAKRNGISRKPAATATGTVHIIGTGNVLIPIGFVFSTPGTTLTRSVTYEATEAVTLEYDEEADAYIADVPIVCTEAGTAGNAPAYGISVMAVPLMGITELYNEESLTDGVDIESDDELRERVMEFDRNRNISYIGNDYDYKRWAMEIEGVGSASVIREWQGPGTGTVKVIILNQSGGSASANLIQEVYDHIMGTEENPDARLAPIGAILTVSTGQAMTINITANVELEEDYTLETIEAGFRKLLNEYFAEAKEDGEVKYTRIARCLSQTPGVIDYRQLLINGTRDNLPVGVEDLPVITSLVLTETEV